jgi:hypothetical protein
LRVKRPLFYIDILTSVGLPIFTLAKVTKERLRKFRLPGKKHLVDGFDKPTVMVMDVTEMPIERPKCHQRWFYSGKKKQHML